MPLPPPSAPSSPTSTTTVSGKIADVYVQTGTWFTGVLLDESGNEVKLSGQLAGAVKGMAIKDLPVTEFSGQFGTEYRIDSKRIAPPAAGPTDPTVRLTELPATPEAVASHLAKHLLGIGAEKSKMLVQKIGPAGLLRALDEQCTDALEAAGITPPVAATVVAQWAERAADHRAEIAMLSIGLNAEQSRRALKMAVAKGAEVCKAALRICQHPYRLTTIPGIGFKTADAAAKSLGVPQKARERTMAAIRQALATASEAGDTMLPVMTLTQGVADLLNGIDIKRGKPRPPMRPGDIPPTEVLGAIKSLDEGREGIIFPDRTREMESPVALIELARAEQTIARRLHEISNGAPDRPVGAFSHQRANELVGLQLDVRQFEAIRNAFSAPVTVITGGPGCGKSTIIRGIVRVAQEAGLRIALSAPTGMAARRMSDVAAVPASTIHRQLGWNGRGQTTFNEQNCLEGDLFVVDEMTMPDVPTSAQLLQALPRGARLVMVGDVDQLPSVGPGAVLSDVIRSNTLPITRLMKSHRIAEESPIYSFAMAIRDGVPRLPDDKADSRLLGFYPREDRDILALTIEHYLNFLGNNRPSTEIMVLSPMRRGLVGIDNLNKVIQKQINRSASTHGLAINRDSDGGEVRAADNDLVIQRTNDVHDLGLVNGDVGVVTRINSQKRSLYADFGSGEIEISGRKLYNLDLAFAKSIHKSQGSEARNGIMCVSHGHRHMLRRNLIYTGVTRIKNSLVLLGDQDAVRAGIMNAEDYHRRTLLQGLLRAQFGRMAQDLVRAQAAAPNFRPQM